MAETDLRSLPRETQVMLAAAVLAFIATFLPFDGIHIHGVGGNENAWNGIAGVFGSLAVVAAAAVVAGMVLAPTSVPALRVSWNFIVAALAAFASLMFIIHWIALPSSDFLGIHYGLSLQWGGYIEILACLVLTALAVLRLRASGEAMPWAGHDAAAPPDSSGPPAV
jgi:hypothetical protein